MRVDFQLERRVQFRQLNFQVGMPRRFVIINEGYECQELLG